MTGKELFEADMVRYNALKGRSWDTGLSDENRRSYRSVAASATRDDLSMEKALDLLDAVRHKAWVEHEFPSLKGKWP